MTGNGKQTRREIYVVANLKEPLLGKPTIEALNLIQKVESIQSDLSYNGIEAEAKVNHPRLFKGLGELSWLMAYFFIFIVCQNTIFYKCFKHYNLSPLLVHHSQQSATKVLYIW